METFIIKREWKDAVIRVEFSEKEVRIETSLDGFANILEERMIKMLPPLTWDFKGATINEKVRDTFRKAWADVTREMKEATIKK